MVRNYVRKTSGPIDCWKVMPEKMKECVEKIEKKQMSRRQAAKYLGISVSSLYRCLKPDNIERRPAGAQRVFTKEDEDIFVKDALILFKHGLPITYFNIRIMIASYLNRHNRIVSRFTNNIPSSEWAQGFVNRHKKISDLLTFDRAKHAERNIESLTQLIDEILTGDVLNVNRSLESTEFAETNSKIKIESSEEDNALNPFSLEINNRNGNDDLEKECVAPKNEENEFHNHVIVKIEEDSRVEEEEKFEYEKSKDKSTIGNDISDPETSNGFKGFEKHEKPRRSERLRNIELDERSRSELKRALFVSEYEAHKWKSKFFTLQKRHNTLIEKMHEFEKLIVQFKKENLI